MKKVEKEVTVRKTVYVALDGKEFSYPDDCIRYEENTLRVDADAICEEIPHRDIEIPHVDYEEDCRIYRVRTQKDLDAILLSSFCIDSTAREFKIDHFPDSVVVVTYEGYGWIQLYDEFISEIQNALADIEKAQEEISV